MAIRINWRNVLKAKTKRQRDLSTWTDEDWGSAEQHRKKELNKENSMFQQERSLVKSDYDVARNPKERYVLLRL